MQSKDIPQVFALYKKQQEKYDVWFKFNQAELGHHLMPRPGVIYTLVVEDDDKKITDFVSFYHLPTNILKKANHNHSKMHIAYLYYYHASEKNSLTELMKYTLYFAKELADVKFDVFNCLNIMDNKQFLQELKFGVGDGILNYYMYNYQLARGFVLTEKVGTVLV